MIHSNGNGNTARKTNPVEILETLKDLISSSIETVKQNALQHEDPALSLDAQEQHPIHNRGDPDAVKALKCISSAAQMLRALCDPTTFLNDIMYGYHDETALWVACQADIANILGEEERDIDYVSSQTGIESEKLARYLRNLCNSLIFKETAPNRFANNQLSVPFKADSKKALVGHCADECRVSSCKAWEALTLPTFKNSKAANKAPFNIAYNTDLTIFQYMADVRPDIGQRCKLAMAGKGLNLEQYLTVYPWAQENEATIIDVGGGVGGATLAILDQYPKLKLKLQDLPDTAPKFKENLEKNFAVVLASGRTSFRAHDFFEPQPEKEADIYFLQHVIHDWPDDDAIKILSRLADAMSSTSKLLICEHVVFPTYRAPHSKIDGFQVEHDDFTAPQPLLANWGAAPTSRLDLQVLTCLNAKQRTEQDFRALVRDAGLAVVRVWRNMGNEAIIQCQLA